MNADEPFFSISQLVDVFKWIVPIAFLFFAFLFIRLRVGSAGFFLHRLWLLLGGKKNFENQIFQNESNKLDDFEKIKYVTGIKFQSLVNVEATLEWLKYRKVGLEELVRIRAYFDPVKMFVSSPNVKGLKFFSNAMMGMFAISAILVLLASISPALFSVKKTGSLFWVTESTAGMLSNDWEFTYDKCLAKKGSWADQSKPSNHDRRVICDLLTSKDKESIISSAIYSQIGVAGLILVLFGYLMVVAARAHITAKIADELHKRIIQEEPSETL